MSGFPRLPSALASIARSPSTPLVPGSGTPITNTNYYTVIVYLLAAGGSGVTIVVGGVSIPALPSNGDFAFLAGPGETITLTYTQAPSWIWRSV